MSVETERVRALGARAMGLERTRLLSASRVDRRTLALAAAGFALLFLLSLYPRAIGVDGYLTTDEGNWMGRTALFARALVDGDPVGTYQSGHPGVMTMWLSLIGMGPARALGLVEHVRPDALEKAPGYLESLRMARVPFTVLTSLAVVFVAALVWRLFGPGPALLSGVLLGLDPFFLAHSVVVHVDSTVTTWMTVCVMAALISFRAGGGRAFLAVSGIAAGLAFLSKAPSALLPVVVALLALSTLVKPAESARGRGAALRRLVLDGLIWGLVALVVPLVLWPSFRAAPLATLLQMIDYTEAVGGSDHENFFLGQPVGDPGPLYYLVCLGFRLTPVTMLGLLLLLVGLLPFGKRCPPGWAGRIGPLAVFCVLFVAMMSMAPKKFDRYLLPIFPTIDVLAALGFWLALRRLPGAAGRRVLPPALLVLGLAQVVPAALVYPYYLAYYNPLLGGGPAARRSIVVGWGEGLDLVTEYLNAKPDADRMTIAGFYPRVMNAQFRGSILSDKQYDSAVADYIVLYVNALQRDLSDRLRTVTRELRSEAVVRINGIEYARVYAVPPPSRRTAANTEFGGVVRLERWFLKTDERQYLKSDHVNPGDTVELTLRWRVIAPASEDLLAVVQLVDRNGAVIAEHQSPLGSLPTLTMRPNDFGIDAHRIELPNTWNEYDLLVGVRRPNGEWLEVTRWPERMSLDSRREPSQVVVESIDTR